MSHLIPKHHVENRMIRGLCDRKEFLPMSTERTELASRIRNAIVDCRITQVR